ncbi:long-chain fatty acid transport protein 2-like [Pholidichthys leucotaenia]
MLGWIVCIAVVSLSVLFRYPYLFQDVGFVLGKLKIRRKLLKCIQANSTILDRFLDRVKTEPSKTFLYFKDDIFTYQDADVLSNKAARVLLQSGCVKEGDTVALFLRNDPMFLWLWLGLVKIGCSGAFLNYNIRSKSLLHCFNCSRAKALVAGEELLNAVEEVLPSLLEQQVTVFVLAEGCKTAGVESFNDKMKQASAESIPKELRSHLTLSSPAIYIYTSGTTGLPKAAVISHLKLWSVSFLLVMSGVTAKDVYYNMLPLYHTTGFLVFGGSIEIGCSLVLKSKFSASQFWDDCRKYNVTVVQYVGEVMRFLCNTPRKINDQNHKLRLAIGNGIRADVWREFITRFGNVQIREFYGATEGNFSLLNYSGKIGAIGRDTFLHKKAFPYAVIKYDMDKEEPLRDSSGFCIETARGEPGLLVSKITTSNPFSGYAGDQQQTEKKKLYNIFEKGDVYFNSGDLVRIDEENFVFFHDRIGDTFRWKGENVATTEVADIVMQVDCIKEANVYGVEVPGQEGRAGMAAVTLRDGVKFDSASVFSHVETFLPNYARPRFLRIQSSLDITGTYKQIKGKLVQEGFSPNKITEPLYFLNVVEKNYTPLTLEIYESFVNGAIKIN